jgi:hypothetical protein
LFLCILQLKKIGPGRSLNRARELGKKDLLRSLIVKV